MNHKLRIALSRMHPRGQENDLLLFSLCLAFFFLFLLPFSCICRMLIILRWSWSYVVCPSTCPSFSIVLVRISCHAWVFLLYFSCCSWKSWSIILTGRYLSARSRSHRILLPVWDSSTWSLFVSIGIRSRLTRLHNDVILSYIVSNGENVARISGDRLAQLLDFKHII